FKNKAKTQKITRNEINEAVKKSGGLNDTRLVAKSYYDKSAGLIPELNAAEEKESELRFILDKAYRSVGMESIK
ncbi:MAG TPA: hypothetical protein VM577_20040, partial [Anaerovoracaceae bacterium]|nr:hypothetical protein [Anaerovoracaceae bacterium]